MSTPSDDELRAGVRELRDANPSLGLMKLLAAVKEAKGWAVSEKRFRKALAEVGGTASGGGASVPSSSSSSKKKGSKGAKKTRRVGDHLDAETHLDPTLDVAGMAPKVSVTMFGGTRGKGLVAREELREGEVLWQEEPFIACASPELQKLLANGDMCHHCLQYWDEARPSLLAQCDKCPAVFCNRLCKERAAESSHHVLLCTGANPGARPLNDYIVSRQWRSLGVVARILARYLSARAQGADAAKAYESRVWSYARVNMAERERDNPAFLADEAGITAMWRTGHGLVVDALNPASSTDAARVQKLLRRGGGRPLEPLSEAETQRWFSYDAFLELLGMVNMNLEDSGGLYALHAHLNHSCEPNLQVRNLPKSWKPPAEPAPVPFGLGRGNHKLTILARSPIPAGDELTVSYVPLKAPRAERQRALREGYGFWCSCPRCEREKEEVD